LRFNANRDQNRTKLLPPGQTWHDFTWPNGNQGKHWSTRDIVTYLIRSDAGTPVDEVGFQQIPFEVDDADLAFLPDWDSPEVETHLVPMRKILDQLINRRRLLTWWL